MADNFNYAALASGAQYGSHFDSTSKSSYSNRLSIEIAYLQRKVYLPILPQERISYAVLRAYDYLIEKEEMPESKYHPAGYWFQEDVFADYYEGNFYIPMICPDLSEPGADPKEFESTMTKYNASEPQIVGGELATDGYVVKSNYVKLKIPKYIAMMFRSTIPKNTQFLVTFTGGYSQPENVTIIGVVSIPETNSEESEEGEEDLWAQEPASYNAWLDDKDPESEEKLKELADIILNNIEAIEVEEDRRYEECLAFKEQEESFFEEGEEL